MSALPIPQAKIGQATTSAIGYGAMGIGGAFYGAAPGDEERFKVLDRLWELGERHIDTADVYGDSEEMLGRWIKRSKIPREELFLATKFGFAAPDFNIRGDAEYIHEALASSLKKLDLDYVDLYYQHRPDPKVPIEVSVGAIAELVKQGKVKNIGLSEANPDTIRRAHKVHPIAAVQVEYSPFELIAEKIGVVATCQELGITVVAYSPAGRGILSGRYKGPEDFDKDDFRAGVPKYSKENFPNILKVTEGLKKIAEKHKATSTQVALAWCVATGTVPLHGSKQLAYCEENIGAAKVKLDEQDLKDIRALAEAADAGNEGSRYPEHFQNQVYIDTPPLQ